MARIRHILSRFALQSKLTAPFFSEVSVPYAIVLWMACLLPATLYGGVALQNLGVQIFILVTGLWITLSGALSPELAKQLRRCGIVLLLFWGVGVLSNIVNALLGSWNLVQGNESVSVTAKVLMTTRVPSSVALAGVLSVIMGTAGLRWSSLRHSTLAASQGSLARDQFQKRFFDVFVFACAGWTALFLAYLLVQHLTGFDHRSAEHMLPTHFQLPNGAYRIRGLYGHPLSMAAVNLAFLFFFAAIATAPQGSCRPRMRACAGFIALSHLVLLSFTGGRTALAAGVLGLPVLMIVKLAPRFGVKRMALAGITGAALATWVGLSTGTGQRLSEAFTTKIDRLEFWRVHTKIWFSNPVFGRGPGFSENGLMDWFYDTSGLENFKERAVAHNVYLQTLADTGIVGMAMAIVLVVILFVALKRSTASALSTSARLGLVAAVIANLAHGLTQNTFFDANVTVVYVAFFFVTLFGFQKPKTPSAGLAGSDLRGSDLRA